MGEAAAVTAPPASASADDVRARDPEETMAHRGSWNGFVPAAVVADRLVAALLEHFGRIDLLVQATLGVADRALPHAPTS